MRSSRPLLRRAMPAWFVLVETIPSLLTPSSMMVLHLENALATEPSSRARRRGPAADAEPQQPRLGLAERAT